MKGALHSLTLELKRAQSLMDAGTFDGARQILSEALAEARKRQLQSAHLHWMLAVSADGEGDLPAAVEHILQALRLDPIAPPFLRSRDIIQTRLLQALHDPERPTDHILTGQIYELAKRLGPLDTESHLVMVRALQAKGELKAALSLVRAILVLDPAPAVAELANELASMMGELDTLPLASPISLVPPT